MSEPETTNEAAEGQSRLTELLEMQELPRPAKLVSRGNLDFDGYYSAQQMVDYGSAAVTAEREACAKVCDSYADSSYENYADQCAQDIRMRSNISN